MCKLCKNTMSSQSWGSKIEKYIMKKFNIKKKKDNVSGDGVSQKNLNIEIKVSLGDENGGFNFVQIRPNHNIDFYLFLCYVVSDNESSYIQWFLCDAKELYKIIAKYGSYAHGTVKKNGKIKYPDMCKTTFEYCLRPNPKNKKKTQKRILWDIMVKKFGVNEKDIISRI